MLAARFEYLAHLVGGYGVDAAAEGYQLNKLDVVIFAGISRRAVETGMEGPLVKDLDRLRVGKMTDAVL